MRLGLPEIFARAFVFDEQIAFPEQVNLAEVAGGFQDGDFKGGDEFAGQAENVEEFVPERLFVRALAGGKLVVARELHGIVTNLVP